MADSPFNPNSFPPPEPGQELVICVLNEPAYLHDVLTAFLEAGAPSATVIESQGMGRILSHDVPVFAGFRHLFAGSKPFNHTIFTVVPNRAMTEDILRLCRDVLADCPEPQQGILFSLPVPFFAKLSTDKP